MTIERRFRRHGAPKWESLSLEDALRIRLSSTHLGLVENSPLKDQVEVNTGFLIQIIVVLQDRFSAGILEELLDMRLVRK